MMRIFLTGGTGLIGRQLIQHLRADGHEIRLLTRDPNRIPAQDGITLVQGDPTVAGGWLDQINDCDWVIHLAGEPIVGQRWSNAFLEKIRTSRVDGTTLVAQQIARFPDAPGGGKKVFLSASAIGFYGLRLDDEELDESSPSGNDFLSEVSRQWEAATQPAEQVGCRVIHFRIGIVLSMDGGALPKMVMPFRFFVGGVVASGKQWMSWIHIDDLVRLLIYSLRNDSISGPINATAPEPVKNWGFSKLLGKVLRRPCWFPTPGFILRIVVGKAYRLVTMGQRVLPRKAIESGFQFRFTDLEKALRNLLNRPE